MKEFSQTDIESAFHALPDDIRSAISSASVGIEISKIAEEEGLHIDEAGIMNNEIGYLMLGLTKPSEFPARITNALSLNKNRTNSIVSKLNERILLPIRKSLVEEDFEEKEKETEILKNNDESGESLNREDILAGIEDDQKTSPSLAQTKLDEPLSSPQQKAVIGDVSVVKPFTPIKKKYITDPYREPLS